MTFGTDQGKFKNDLRDFKQRKASPFPAGSLYEDQITFSGPDFFLALAGIR